MKVIIVDDEPKAIQLLSSYVEQFAELELVGTFRQPLQALEFLRAHAVDLLFLDINMPRFSGLSLARVVDPGLHIIFTTAYAEHAAESYEIGAENYLLKPISLPRFAEAVTRLLARRSAPVPPTAERREPVVVLKSGTRWYRLPVAEIDYLEKDGNYMHYHAGEQRIMVRQTIAEALDVLPEDFVQIHKSFVVPVRKIAFVDTDQVAIGTHRLPLSTRYKAALLDRMQP